MLSVSNHNRGTMLVVDDSPEIRRYLRRLLELDGYEVETASDGKEALRRLRDGLVPQLVLLDMQMPGMNGLSALRRLRKLHPELPVIMCSGEEDNRKIRRAAALGAKAYIRKPVRHLYLSAALDYCLGTLYQEPQGDDFLGAVITFPATPVLS